MRVPTEACVSFRCIYQWWRQSSNVYRSFACIRRPLQNVRPKHYPLKLKVDSYNYFEFFKKIKKVRPKLIAIANPNQPIEVMLTLKQINAVCKLAEKIGSLVIIDEAYYHFNNVTAQPLINKFKNLIVVRTFSKAFGLAGMRIGYTISNKKNIGLMLSIKPIYEINAFNMKLVRLLIKNIKVMKDYVQEVHKVRLQLKKFLKSKNIEMIGKYSNTVLFKLESKKKIDKVIKYLFKNKFIVRPMTIDNDNRFIRANIVILSKNNEKIFIFTYVGTKSKIDTLDSEFTDKNIQELKKILNFSYKSSFKRNVQSN